jgi:hypothetical protein
MIYFIHAKGYDMNMHAKIQYDDMHGLWYTISLRFDLLEFYLSHYGEKGDEVKFIGKILS